MADKFLRCKVVGSIANSITVKPYVDGAGMITVRQQDNILFDPDTLRAEGAEEMRQAALNALARTAREKFNLSDEFNHYLAGLMDGENAIRQLPSIQPERKQGRWVAVGECYVKCSECGLETTKNELRGIALFGENEPYFCPNCGADMRGGDTE